MRYGSRLWGYIELDQGGAVHKRRTRTALEQAGLAPIPVYHPFNDGWDYFDELCARYDRICVGNVVQAPRAIRCRIFATVWERQRAYPDVWIHYLGVTPTPTQIAYPVTVVIRRHGWDLYAGAMGYAIGLTSHCNCLVASLHGGIFTSGHGPPSSGETAGGPLCLLQCRHVSVELASYQRSLCDTRDGPVSASPGQRMSTVPDSGLGTAMFTLAKTFRFEASHQLPLHEGQCARLHGHSWVLTVEVRGATLQESGSQSGMLLDYAIIEYGPAAASQGQARPLPPNDTTGLANPTSEEVARWIYGHLKPLLPDLSAITLDETCTASCRYTDEP